MGPGSTRKAEAHAPSATKAPIENAASGKLSDSDWREVFREIVRGDFKGTPSQQREGAFVRGARRPFLESQAGAGILNVGFWSSLGADEPARRELERLFPLMDRIETEEPPSPEPGRELDFPDRVDRALYRLGSVPYQFAKEAAKRFGKRGGFGPLIGTVDASTDIAEKAYAEYRRQVEQGIPPELAARNAARAAVVNALPATFRGH